MWEKNWKVQKRWRNYPLWRYVWRLTCYTSTGKVAIIYLVDIKNFVTFVTEKKPILNKIIVFKKINKMWTCFFSVRLIRSTLICLPLIWALQHLLICFKVLASWWYPYWPRTVRYITYIYSHSVVRHWKIEKVIFHLFELYFLLPQTCFKLFNY